MASPLTGKRLIPHPPTQGYGTMKPPSSISRDELRNGLRSGTLTVVDVLSEESFQSGHIPGAINLPMENLADRARESLPDLHAEIVVYCGKFT
jgi:rhodanese-related sulfurtransferase